MGMESCVDYLIKLQFDEQRIIIEGIDGRGE